MKRIAFALVLVASLPATAASAQDGGSVALSLGVFNYNKTPTSLEGGLEIAGVPRGFGLAPAFGIAGTEDGSAWIWGGLRRSFELGGRWSLVPGFGIALYEEGSGETRKDLGGLVEFRSSIELNVGVGMRTEVGVLVYHLSNAGIYDLNPGANSAVLVWRWYAP